ncbi:hypothetical protein Hanom_Chr15g01397471 [Helianthus anomalus]
MHSCYAVVINLGLPLLLQMKKTNNLLLADCRGLVHLFCYRCLQMWSADCRRFTFEKTNNTFLSVHESNQSHFRRRTLYVVQSKLLVTYTSNPILETKFCSM